MTEELSRQRDERGRLLATIERLTEQIVRVQRFSQGMSEAPREPRKLDPMPPEIHEIIETTSDSRIRAMQAREAWRRYAELGSWDAVGTELMRPAVVDMAFGPETGEE